ncbi:MAG TPA: helix-turn-helix domain-containing protein [Streptosporangiaceae bacterium]|jgi:DNA-binding transcriptional ArsR family regulator
MVRVNFTADDLARTRFSEAPAPLIETGMALVELRRASLAPERPAARRWLREIRRTFPATARPLLDLFGPYPPWPAFADSPATSLEEGLEFIQSAPRSAWRADLTDGCLDRLGRPPSWVRNLADGDTESRDIVVRALRDFYAAVVAPRWESVVSSFHGDVARRMPVLAAGGHQALFGTLHRQLRWQDNGLERQGVDFEHDLCGSGMLMMPSAFWTGPPVFVLDGERTPNVLVYAARPGGPDHASSPGAAGNDSLATLIGSTRAAVLRALAEPCGTAGLAATTGISVASASEHAKALRDADLIQTRREGRSVRHSLTPLGRTMLGQLRSAAT